MFNSNAPFSFVYTIIGTQKVEANDQQKVQFIDIK